MKSFKTILALAFATLFAGSAALVAADAAKPDAKPAKASCGCVVKADGKVCGVDSDCCCSGEKAKGKSEAAKDAAAEKKAEKKAGCTDAKCAEAGCAEGGCKTAKECKSPCASCAK